MGKTEER